MTRLKAEAPCPLVYVQAREPGVSNARNAGFAGARGRFIAQLDDDESASPFWLEALLDTQERLDASVVFGPVTADAEAVDTVAGAWLRRLYSRKGPAKDQHLDKPYGCGNSLIDRAAAALPEPVFDPAANRTGGEDDILFEHLSRKGAVFAWSAGAHAIEHVEGARARLTHMARRSFAFGQGAAQACAHDGRRDWVRTLIWMGVGAAQLAVFGLAAAPARALDANACAVCIDKAVQGAGKLVWIDAAAPRLYGAAPARG